MGNITKPIFTPKESKQIGWDEDLIENYPTKGLLDMASRLHMIRWYRFLADPTTPEEAEFICDLVIKLRATYPEPLEPRIPVDTGPSSEMMEKKVEAARVLDDLLHGLT